MQSQGNIPRFTDGPRPPRIDLSKIPFPLVAVGIISVFITWVPLAYFARARATLAT